MTQPIATPTRRPDIDQAINHLVNLFTPQDPSEDLISIVRRAMKDYGNIGAKPSFDGVRIDAVSAGGVPAEWVVAENANPRMRIVHTHGGGWSAGDTQGYRAFGAALSRLSGASVLLVDYRLAPEYPLPAGLDDCLRALAWAAENGPGNNGQSDRSQALSLSLSGDSAGGALAAATCMQAIATGARVPERLVLLSPQLDVIPHPETIPRDDLLVRPEGVWIAYLAYTDGGKVPPSDPRVSPVYTPTELLARFPPTLIQISAAELFMEQSRRFARRLEEAGVRHSLSVWPGLPHVWHILLGLLPEATEALQEMADFVRPQTK